ncbi:MAG: TonB-dependent receptor [Pseudomonadota bacterium]
MNKKHAMRSVMAANVTAALALLQAGPVQAQSAPQAQDAPEQANVVMVTARRTLERQQDVPVAVSTLSAGQMEQRAMVDLRDIARFTPNVYMSSTGAQSPDQVSMFIRGIGLSDAFATTDPGVGLYIDGVYFSRSQGGVMDLLDLERIEVLRGPQGTLFGKGTAGGAINVVSKAPNHKGGGELALSVGNLGQREVSGRANIGLSETVALSVSALSKHRDCLANRSNDGACYGSIRRDSGRAFLRWTPNADLKVDLIGDVTHGKSTVRPHHPIGYDPNSGAMGLYSQLVPAVPGGNAYTTTNPGVNPARYAVGGTSPTEVPLRSKGVSLQVEYSLPSATLHSISSYRSAAAPSFEDTLGNPNTGPYSPAQVASYSKSDWWSQEFRLDGSAGKLHYITGLYYFHEQAQTNEGANLFPPVPLGWVNFNDQTQRSYAAFAHLQYALTHKLSASAGVRYSGETKELQFKYFHLGLLATPSYNPATDMNAILQANPAAYPNELQAAPGSTAFSVAKGSWKPITWQYGLDYKAAKDLMVFANVARGFRSGGFNGRASSGAATNGFNPEYTTSYELGLKSSFANNRVLFNATAFHTDYKDLQQTILTCARDAAGNCLVGAGGVPMFSPIVANAAAATLVGGEAELKIAVGALRFDGSVGYVHAKFKDVDPLATQATGLNTDSKMPFVPKLTGALGVQYEFATGAGRLTPRLDYTYRSEVAYNPNPGPHGKVGPLGLVNASLLYKSNTGGWSVSLYARNLLDKEYITSANEYKAIGASDTGAVVAPADPREFGIKVSRKF